MTLKKIYILRTNNCDKHPNVLIWSDNEKRAREKAYIVSPATPLNDGVGDPITIEDLTYYQNPDNATCEKLEGDSYEVINHDEEYIKISFCEKIYYLAKDEPEKL